MDDAAATVRQFEILHGGEEHLGLHLDSLCKQLPGARSKDIRQGIIDLVGLTKPNNTAILVHGVSLSLRGSGRLDTRLDTPPISYRHHPVSRLAHDNIEELQRACRRSQSQIGFLTDDSRASTSDVALILPHQANLAEWTFRKGRAQGSGSRANNVTASAGGSMLNSALREWASSSGVDKIVSSTRPSAWRRVRRLLNKLVRTSGVNRSISMLLRKREFG